MTYKREMTLWKIRSHSTVLLKKKHFLFTSYEEKKRHLCWWNCSCPSFMVWLFLPKWVICPQGDDVTVSFSIKEHEVKTVLYFMYCKTPCLMLLSVECLSSTSLQCSQLQCSFFPAPEKPNFTISRTHLWTQVSILNQASWQILSSWMDTGNSHCSFLKKLPVVLNVTQNSWGQEGSPNSLNACGSLGSFPQLLPGLQSLWFKQRPVTSNLNFGEVVPAQLYRASMSRTWGFD